MNAAILLGLISAAAVIALVIGHRNRGEKIRLLLGGIAVAAGIIALALLAEAI